ncbi:ABC transporter [Sphingomonas sp. Root710]|uniref:ABC transporter permease n=1 Tax=Sphingomonas sp. Root710 TaxID=1736594 RepID=UPI0006FBCD5E|nr:ABC transporter permease [Sphingomonas sp. Root710]KRB81295.1 ABC transporter [Sphingomonas sp. Root710]
MSTAPRTNFYHQLTLQLDVIGALVLRELHSRFGRNNIGYLWLIGEPLMLATVIGALHAFQPGHLGSTMPPVPFALIGYCVFIVLRGVINRSESLLETNVPLMYHRMISVLNLSIARVVIEAAGCFCSLVILLGLAIPAGYADMPARPLYLLAGFGWMVWISFALGLNVTAVTFGKPTLGRLVHPITYFMMPLSGAFFAVEWLPYSIQQVADWNPLVTIFEYARYGMFEVASDEHLFPGYLNSCCAILTYTGLIGIRRVRHKLHIH